MNNKQTDWGAGFTIPPESYWMASTERTNYPALNEDVKVDTAILGGGMVGVLTAYLLKKEGMKVAIIEADHILQGTTAHTTAKLTSQHGLIYSKTQSSMGEEKARMYAEANESAIDFIEKLAKEKNIDCDFVRCAAHVYTQQDNYVQNIQDEVDAARQMGIKASYLEELALPYKVKAAVRFENQARFHPLKLLLPLAKEIPGKGSYIFEQARVIDVVYGDTCTVITNREPKVTASNVVVASHFPCYEGFGFYFSRLYPERSYLLGVRINGKPPEDMYISAEDPGRSLRIQPTDKGDLLLVGAEHHKTGQGPDMITHYANIRTFAEENFDVVDIPYRWSTQDYKTPDSIPYIGRITSEKQNVYVATGFRKWGMTNSTVSAQIISDLIIKGENPWEPVYNPSRFTPAASAKTFVIENANVAKELISGKLEAIPDDVEIPSGEARIVEVKGQRVGAYRDEKGKLHLVDTTCAHMGCELMWNSAERSWDCPCHGSRYTYEGEIIDGPAVKPLKTDMNNNNDNIEEK